ncbi:peptidase M23 [Litorivita pollutaquae]|uniref:Peptidase M23 n=1 Tax=Litorivita pollutaquae TaxID=2200892 RepID=A0A2V4MTA7_9RHOB|nr:peptidase M23 [Litorivita pollutaquae]PYC47428.1 peptidase M23 [Litorivita pollutaquae]
MIRIACLIVMMMAGMLRAEVDARPDARVAARDAAQRLDAAARQMDKATTAKDRVKALSETVHAYEDGLDAMRDGLRRATVQEQRISRELKAREIEISRLLGVLQSIGAAPAPATLLHPDGPVGTARAGMVLADIMPGVNSEAASLRAQFEEVTTLRLLQKSATETLQKGLVGAQEARTALSQAVADRTDLPRRFTADPVRTAILIASTETLEGFASGLSQITDAEGGAPLPDISHRQGTLPLPVQGQVLRRAGEADAAGIQRPGIVMATRPQALVTTPTAATIRYRGPLLDYGNVMILEPQTGLLLVLAGLDVVYGHAGEVLPAGAPVGLMAGDPALSGEILQETPAGMGIGSGNRRSETLYIEIRQDNTPVDPELWFETDKDD